MKNYVILKVFIKIFWRKNYFFWIISARKKRFLFFSICQKKLFIWEKIMDEILKHFSYWQFFFNLYKFRFSNFSFLKSIPILAIWKNDFEIFPQFKNFSGHFFEKIIVSIFYFLLVWYFCFVFYFFSKFFRYAVF